MAPPPIKVPERLTLTYPGTDIPWVRGVPVGQGAVQVPGAVRAGSGGHVAEIKRWQKEGERWHFGTFYPKGAIVRYGPHRWLALRPSVGKTIPPHAPDEWERIESAQPATAKVPILPPVPRPRRGKRRGRRLGGKGDQRGYAKPPMNPADAKVFWAWQKDLERRGKSVIFPGGAREKYAGAWRAELIAPSDVAQGEPLWLREYLQELAADWAAWTALLGDRPSWLVPWAAGLREDPRSSALFASIPDQEWAEMLERRDPVELARVLLGVVTPAGADRAPAEGDAEDYDPLLHGNYTDWAKSRGIKLAGPEPLPAAPVLRHAQPIRMQTIREVPVRDPKTGLFTGERKAVMVPTMRIDLESELGRKIRIVDDDGRHGKDPPRGALARIQTSSGKRKRYHWIVPVEKNGGYSGAKRDDKRHVRMRRETGAETIQIVDHRSGKPRTAEILVTKRSKNYELAQQFAAEFERLKSGLK